MTKEFFDKSIKSKMLEIGILKAKRAFFLYLTNDCDLFDKAAAYIVNGSTIPNGLSEQEREQIAAHIAKIKALELNLYKFNFNA